MKILLLITASFISLINYSSAQSILSSDIIGKWNVIKFYPIDEPISDEFKEMTPEEKKKLKVIQDGFLKSKFEIKADGNFSFDCGFSEMKIEKGYWKIIKGTNKIVVQEWEDKDKNKPVLMEIIVKFLNGKTIFIIEESFFAYEMMRST